jgi:hypothetical protein
MRPFVVAVAAVVLAVACPSCGETRAGSATAKTAASGPDVPETLSAATAAAQADIDRFTSGDFAGVWQHMSRDVRTAISEADFVTLYETCKTLGPRISVAGVSLVDGEATVRMRMPGGDRYRIMRYEDDHWVMAPTPEFAARLGKPVGQIIAEERAAGLCSR